MTQPPHDFTGACGDLLRQSRGLLEQGDLVWASSKGWDAAVNAADAYASMIAQSGGSENFKHLMQRLSKDHRGVDGSVEWAVSALALADNAQLDWLDRGGIQRRLDDMQRLVNLVFDIANPPQDGEALLRRAWACLANGSLAVASEKGWEAAAHAAKAYATAMGHDRIRSNYVSQVTRLLKEEPGGNQVGNWSMSASMLHENAISDPDWLDLEIIREDLQGVSQLVSFIGKCIESHENSGKSPNV